MDVTLHASSSTKSLITWLKKHGQGLRSLDLKRSWPSSTTMFSHLPCSQLRSLSVHGGTIQLGPASSGGPGLLADTQHLTALTLSCRLEGGSDALAVLQDRTCLQRLQLKDGSVHLDDGMLPHLVDITSLSAYVDMDVGQSSIGGISSLTNLQLLDLDVYASFFEPHEHAEAGLGALHGLRSLTRLYADFDFGICHCSGCCVHVCICMAMPRLLLRVLQAASGSRESCHNCVDERLELQCSCMLLVWLLYIDCLLVAKMRLCLLL